MRIFNEPVWPVWSVCLLVLLFSGGGVWSEDVEVPQFVNVAREAGLTFRHVNGAAGRYYAPEVNGAGIAAFDYNNDGWVDLYVVNGSVLPGYEHRGAPPVNALYRNNGDGTFTDVTADAGVGDRGYGMGCVSGDYDNDGDADLYVSNFGANVLYRNNGDGTFTDVTAGAGVGDEGFGAGCAFADYDNDGDLDLYVANYVTYKLGDEQSARIPYVSMALREKGLGGARAYSSPKSFSPGPNRLYRNEGDGTFTEVSREVGVDDVQGRHLGVVFCDYDGDGDADLYVADDEGDNSLFRNDGPWPGGRFSDEALFAGVAYDGDGDSQATMGVVFGDYDNDGRFDLATTSFQGEVFALYHNDGGGFFSDVSFATLTGQITLPMLAWGLAFLDYDNDGDMDLFFACGHAQDGVKEIDPSTTTPQRNLLFRNNGDGTFTDVSLLSGPGFRLRRQSRGGISLDYDNDGDMDIAVFNKRCTAPAGVEDGVDLLRNEGGNRKHWLVMKLVGGAGEGQDQGSRVKGQGSKSKKQGGGSRLSTLGPRLSNRDGVGARVTVWAGRLRQVREVRRGSGYQSQNDPRLHVGLGDHARADSIEVRWPGGRRQVLRGVAADRILTIVEPDG